MTEEVDENFLDSLSDIEKHYTVFAGSSEDDVAYAKLFWSSLFLQPPLESRLVSADIRQRLKVAKAPQCNLLWIICETYCVFNIVFFLLT